MLFDLSIPERLTGRVFVQGDKDFTPAAAQVAHQKPQPGVPKHPPIQHIKPQIHQPRKWAGAAGYHGNYSSTSRPSLPNGTHETKTFPLQAQIFEILLGAFFWGFFFLSVSLFVDLRLRGETLTQATC